MSFVDFGEPERGRHESFEAHIEGKYVFERHPGTGSDDQRLAAYKSVTEELKGLIAEALAGDKEVRVHGSFWSSSEVAIAKDRLLNSKRLRNLHLTVPRATLSPAYAGDPDKLRFLECGEGISDINEMLAAEGLSLKTSGSNNGQTLAGALSTGTHGSNFSFGAVSEFVVGLHIVTGPTRHVYVQRASAPVVQQAFADRLGATFVENDQAFDAALVSFGAFGIIQGVMIETRALFTLHATRFVHPYDQALKTAMTTLDFSGIDLSGSELPATAPRDRLHHFQVYFNPNQNEDAPPTEGHVLMMYEDQWNQSYQRPDWGSESGPAAGALEVVAAILERIPQRLRRATLPMLNRQIGGQLESYYRYGIVRDLFTGIRPRGHLLLSGTAVPLERSVQALDILFKAYIEFGTVMPIVVATRFVKRSTATLGFTRFDDTCVFDIDTLSTDKSREFVNVVRGRLETAGIPFTVHWGKLERELTEFVTPARLRSMYGDAAVDSWRAAREGLLEHGDVARLFTNDFMRSVGLG